MKLALIVAMMWMPWGMGAKPSVLFCSPHGAAWGWADLTYMQELHAAGYEVDYTNRLSDVTDERICQYHVLVVYEQPQQADLLAYVRDGGGVLLFPTEKNIEKQRLYDITEQIGAKLPVEIIVEQDEAKISQLTQASRTVPLFYTDNVASSPLTEGVNGVWYPSARSYNAQHTGPIAVDDNWTVLLRGSTTSVTEPFDLAASNTPDLLDPFIRPEGVEAPPLFAVRELGKGRIALLNQWRQYTVGSGTRFIYNYEVLRKGVAGRPSDMGRLLRNTFQWLAEPAMQSDDRPGGYTMPEGRLDPPNEQEEVIRHYREPTITYEPEQLDADPASPHWHLYRGMIGIRPGGGSVADYARVAREGGLSFLVILAEFEGLTADKLEALRAECEANSSEDLQLYAGYTITTNIGNHMYFYGPNPVLPPEHARTGPNKELLDLQPQNEEGLYLGTNGSSFNWLLWWSNNGNSGYYNFAGSGPTAMKMQDLRAFSQVAVRYYRGTEKIEELTEDYLETVAGTLPPMPVTFNEIRSPQELQAVLDSDAATTWVRARSMDWLWQDALRWSHQYKGDTIFSTDGPLVHNWGGCHRTHTLGGECFVTGRSLMMSPLSVSSEAGLQEVRIYNGPELYRRFLPGGAKKWHRTLVLDGTVQKNLALIVEDVNGKRAICSPRRSWKDGQRAVVFCGDHVNDCKSGGWLLGRGPTPILATWINPMHDSVAGYTWDGGPPASRPLVQFQETRPLVRTPEGTIDGRRFTQTPILEFTDGGGVAITNRYDRVFSEELLRVVNPWHTFGPIAGPSPDMSYVLRYREWVPPTVATPPVGWAGPGVLEGTTASIFRSEITFKREFTLDMVPVLLNNRKADVGLCFMVIGSEMKSYELYGSGQAVSTVLQRGDWFGLYSPALAASHLFVNRGAPLVLSAHGGHILLGAHQDAATVAAGDTLTHELFSLGIPLYLPVASVEDLAAYYRYLHEPEGLSITRGERGETLGCLDIAAADGAAALSLPRPTTVKGISLPVRVTGLNRRWSTGLWQQRGYVKGFYGDGTDRYRALGLDVDGNAYVPLHVARADQTAVVAGHPVIADEAGRDLFIQVTHVNREPQIWHVAVNNPTDAPITTTLSRAMDLPGFTFERQQITLQPGEYRRLQ